MQQVKQRWLLITLLLDADMAVANSVPLATINFFTATASSKNCNFRPLPENTKPLPVLLIRLLDLELEDLLSFHDSDQFRGLESLMVQAK